MKMSFWALKMLGKVMQTIICTVRMVCLIFPGIQAIVASGMDHLSTGEASLTLSRNPLNRNRGKSFNSSQGKPRNVVTIKTDGLAAAWVAYGFNRRPIWYFTLLSVEPLYSSFTSPL